MMRIIVGIDCLSFQPCNCVKLLDGSSTQARQSPEHCAFDLGHLGILYSIYQSVLGLCCMILQLLRRVLFAKGSNFVEVHLEIVGHFLGELIFWTLPSGSQTDHRKGPTSEAMQSKQILRGIAAAYVEQV